MFKKTLLILFLCLCFFVLWLEAPAHLEQLEDDEYVGKTLLIYPTAGRFVLDDSWYFGKRKGDSWFYSQRLDKNSELPPKLYKIVAKYQEYYHGFKRLFGKYGITQYLIESVDGKTDRRLFMSALKRRKCKEQTNLTNPETGIKVDLVCH